MKPNNVTKLYAVLTNKERAAVMFHHIVAKNRQEVARVKTSIPHQTFDGAHIEYTRWFDAIWDVASQFGMEHWRLKSIINQRFCQFLLFDLRQDDEYAENAFEKYISENQVLLALHRAMEVLCVKHGLNIAAIKEFIGMESEHSIIEHGLEPDTEMQARYIERLSRLLPPT